MKKSIFLILTCFMLLAFTVPVVAQDVPLYSMKATYGAAKSTGNAFDTIKTTSAVYLYSNALAGKNDVTITAVATEVSGTTSGTLSLEVSQDGTSWSSYYDSKDSAYTKSLTDVTTAQVYRWEVLGSNDKYFRVKAVGGGSVSVRLTATCKSSKSKL